MTEVNIIFDGMFNDADIIVIPDAISSEIEKIGQEFLDWVPSAEDSQYWMIKNGEKCSVVETDGFVKWLNDNYREFEKAYVIERNTNYNPENKSVEF